MPAVAAFTGKATDAGFDPDGNGLFEYLKVDVELEVIQPGHLTVVSNLLTPEGDPVAIGSLEPAIFRQIWAHGTEVQGGRR